MAGGRRFRRASAVAAIAASIGLIAPADAIEAGGEHRRPRAKVLAEGLSSPKGLSVGARHNLVIAQGAFGPPAPVLSYQLHGPGKGTLSPLSGPFTIIDIAVNVHDGTTWAIAPSGSVDPEVPPEVWLYYVLADRVTIIPVLNITSFQSSDPDPVDQEGVPTDSNPYGLAVARNGDALVVDAGGNDLLRVTPAGHVTVMARFDVESVSTDHIPPDPAAPLPPTIDAEAVPTTVTVGPDGSIYVGELKGFPFRPGTSRIWRIDPEADGAWCSVDEPDPTWDCHRYSRGYNSIQDIAFNHHTGELYVYQFAEGGVLAFEAGFGTGVFPPAVLLEVKHPWKLGRHRRELARGELSQPGGIVVHHGTVYVTDGMFTGGRLLKIRT